MKRLISITELARLLCIAKGTLYNWCSQRRVPFVKVGRALRFDLDEVQHAIRHIPAKQEANK